MLKQILNHSMIAVFLLLIVGSANLLVSCEEQEVPFIIDQDEIRQYLDITEEGKELFRVDGLVPGDPLVINSDPGAVYTEVVDSTSRMVSIDVVSADGQSADPAQSSVAHVEVMDRIYVTTTRIEGADTGSFSRDRNITRYAYFEKLGDDLRPFAGWLLRRYKGVSKSAIPPLLTVTLEDGTSFGSSSSDYRDVDGIMLEDIANVSKGERLALRYATPSPSMSVSAETDAGFQASLMVRSDVSTFVDTIATPTDNGRLWNILYFEEFGAPAADTSGAIILPSPFAAWCVPFRVPQ